MKKGIRAEREWNRESQSVWNCLKSSLDGLKSCGWLSLGEHLDIMAQLQNCIENKE